MLVIHSFPKQIGVQVGHAGNPEIVAADGDVMVIIELDPESWKAFLASAPRLRGVGIARANRADTLYVPGEGNGEPR